MYLIITGEHILQPNENFKNSYKLHYVVLKKLLQHYIISNLSSKRIKQYSCLIKSARIKQYKELKTKIDCVIKFHAQSYFAWVIIFVTKLSYDVH